MIVDYLGHIKNLLRVGQSEDVQIKEGALVSDLLLFLAEKHGAIFRDAIYEPNGLDLKANFILSVNGLLLNQLNGIKTQLKDGDRVALMPIVSGG